MTLLEEPTLPSIEVPATPRARRNRPVVALEVVLFMGLVLLATVAYEPVFRSFGTFVGPVFGAAALSCLIAVALKRLHIAARFSVLISLVAAALYLSYTVLVDELAYGVVPGPDTLDALREGIGHGWQHILDGTLPVTDTAPALVWLSAVVWIVAHLTTDLVQRSRLVALPLVAPIGLFGLSLPLVSATDEPSVWLVGAFIGLALGAVLVRAVPDARTVRGLGTTTDGITEFHSRSVMSARLRMGLPIAAVAVLVAPLLAEVVTGDDPFDPRDLRDEITVPEFVSDPLGQLKAQISGPENAAFRVSFGDPSDALDVQRVSVLHLDTYDGVRWTSNGAFREAGGRLTPTTVPTDGRDIVQTYTIAAVDDPWLPVAGTPLEIDLATVAYDAESGDLLAPGSVSGLTYRVVSHVTEPSPDDLADDAPSDDPDLRGYEELGGEMPPAIAALAAQATAGSTSPADSLVRLEQFLLTEYRYDPEATAGHSYGRLLRFLTDDHRGTAEQFAASYAVLARALGFPTRVVVGYKVVRDVDGVLTPIDFVSSRDYHAWVEVMFDDLDWVAFDPTPQLGDTPLPQEEDPTAPATTVAPPPANGGQATPEEAGPTEGLPEPDNEDTGLSSSALLYGAGALGGVVLLLAIASLTVIALKRRRRKQRKRAPAAADRIVGAWDEVLDRLSEMHFPFDPAMTPRDVARAGVATFGAPAAEPLGSLAPTVSRAVFAREEPAEVAVDAAWECTAVFERNLAATLTRRQRLAARLSPRPLRRRMS